MTNSNQQSTEESTPIFGKGVSSSTSLTFLSGFCALLESQEFILLVAYVLILFVAYYYGKNSGVSLSKYGQALQNYQNKISTVKVRLGQVSTAMTALSVISTLSLLAAILVFVAELYSVSGQFVLLKHAPMSTLRRTFMHVKMPVLILLGIFTVGNLIRKILGLWHKSLINSQKEVQVDKERSIMDLLDDLGPEITDALSTSVAKPIKDENHELHNTLRNVEKDANEKRKNIIITKNYIDAYDDFLKGLGEFSWCKECMAAVSNNRLGNVQLTEVNSPDNKTRKSSGTDIPLPFDRKPSAPLIQSPTAVPTQTNKPSSPTEAASESNKDQPTITVTEAAQKPSSPEHKEELKTPTHFFNIQIPMESSGKLSRQNSLNSCCLKNCLGNYLHYFEQLKTKLQENQTQIKVMEKYSPQELRGK